MTTEEFRQKISDFINSDLGYGFEVYACLHNSSCIRFILDDSGTDSFKDAIADKISSCISDSFLSDIELKQVTDVHDNTNSLFEIVQNENYCPFSFIETPEDGSFSDNEKQYLTGFAFKFNINNSDPYPEKWTLRISAKSKHIYKFSSARIKKQTNYQVRENSANKTKRNPLFKQKHKLRTQEKDKI